MAFRSSAIILAVGLATLSVATSAQATHRTHARAHHGYTVHRAPYAAYQPPYGQPQGFFGDGYAYRPRGCVPLGPDAVQCGGTRWEYHGGTAGM